AGALERFDLNPAPEIVADGADVLGAESEAGAGDYRAGDLSAGTEVLLFEGDFAGVRGKVGDDEEGVGGVEAYADYVEVRHVECPIDAEARRRGEFQTSRSCLCVETMGVFRLNAAMRRLRAATRFVRSGAVGFDFRRRVSVSISWASRI